MPPPKIKTACLPPASVPMTPIETRFTPPPDHLRSETKTWWVAVVNDFDLEPHHARLLRLACEAWDAGQAARESLAMHGSTYTDRFGQPRARPEVAIERDSRISFARLVRELALDVAGPGDARPPRLAGNAALAR
jgi:phage terminase small subunit